MWSFINKYDAHILSAYSTKDANSRKGKMKWLKKRHDLLKKVEYILFLENKNKVCNDKWETKFID